MIDPFHRGILLSEQECAQRLQEKERRQRRATPVLSRVRLLPGPSLVPTCSRVQRRAVHTPHRDPLRGRQLAGERFRSQRDRSLMSDREMSYEVVEKGADGTYRVRRIVNPGPTGLITTSTKPLGDQASTRTLTVTIPDSPGHTQLILRPRWTGLTSPTNH